MSDCKPKTIVLDNVEYVRADSVVIAPTGNRCVIVVDRGWIFAGDVTECDGRIRLNRAVHVVNWSNIGFDGMLKEPEGGNVKLKKLEHVVNLPADAEIFRVPVSNDWGL